MRWRDESPGSAAVVIDPSIPPNGFFNLEPGHTAAVPTGK